MICDFFRYRVRFSSTLTTVKLIPGRDGQGSILWGWIDAVKAHDEIVQQCEEKMDEVDSKKADFMVLKREMEVRKGNC